MKFFLAAFLSFSLVSCSLLSKYRKTAFTYTSGGKSFSIPILVPKGYTRERTEVDSSGNTRLEYFYGGKTYFYVAHLEDTTALLLPIAEDANIPHVSRTGALIYKGQDAEQLFWREIRKGDLRVGYRYVPVSREARFDSATNFAAFRPLGRKGQ